MPTLKNLVDETTNIKNELKECHANLKNNLTEKGVECDDADKFSSLVNKISSIKFVDFGYGDSFLIDDNSFLTPLSTSYNLKNAYYHTFNINDVVRDNVSTYTLSLKLAHSTVNKTDFIFTICDSSQTVLHEINIPTFKYEVSLVIDLDYMPSDNMLGFYMYNTTTTTKLNTKCVLSCDIKIT